MITDSNGYDLTKNSISKFIVHYLELLKIDTNEKELLERCMKFLNKIIYNVPVVFRSKPHKAIALVIIFLASKKFGCTLRLKDIYRVSGYKSQKIINKCYVTLKKLLP